MYRLWENSNAPICEVLDSFLIAKTEEHFDGLGKSFHKKGKKLLRQCWNECAILPVDFVSRRNEALPTIFCFISNPRNVFREILFNICWENIQKLFAIRIFHHLWHKSIYISYRRRATIAPTFRFEFTSFVCPSVHLVFLRSIRIFWNIFVKF